MTIPFNSTALASSRAVTPRDVTDNATVMGNSGTPWTPKRTISATNVTHGTTVSITEAHEETTVSATEAHEETTVSATEATTLSATEAHEETTVSATEAHEETTVSATAETACRKRSLLHDELSNVWKPIKNKRVSKPPPRIM